MPPTVLVRSDKPWVTLSDYLLIIPRLRTIYMQNRVKNLGVSPRLTADLPQLKLKQ